MHFWWWLQNNFSHYLGPINNPARGLFFFTKEAVCLKYVGAAQPGVRLKAGSGLDTIINSFKVKIFINAGWVGKVLI